MVKFKNIFKRIFLFFLRKKYSKEGQDITKYKKYYLLTNDFKCVKCNHQLYSNIENSFSYIKYVFCPVCSQSYNIIFGKIKNSGIDYDTINKIKNRLLKIKK